MYVAMAMALFAKCVYFDLVMFRVVDPLWSGIVGSESFTGGGGVHDVAKRQAVHSWIWRSYIGVVQTTLLGKRWLFGKAWRVLPSKDSQRRLVLAITAQNSYRKLLPFSPTMD